MVRKRAKRKKDRGTTTERDKPSTPSYRVWKLHVSLRNAISDKRTSRQQTVREFVGDAVDEELRELIENLAELGIANDSVTNAAVRFPMGDSTLTQLRAASQESGLDQSQLLTACLRLAIRRKRRRNRKT